MFRMGNIDSAKSFNNNTITCQSSILHFQIQNTVIPFPIQFNTSFLPQNEMKKVQIIYKYKNE